MIHLFRNNQDFLKPDFIFRNGKSVEKPRTGSGLPEDEAGKTPEEIAQKMIDKSLKEIQELKLEISHQPKESETTDKFETYLSGLNKTHFKPEKEEAYLEKYGEKNDFDTYEDLSEQFQTSIENQMEEVLEAIFETEKPENRKAKLEQLKNEMRGIYKDHVGKKGYIDFKKLKESRRAIEPIQDLVRFLYEGKEATEIAKRMESMGLLEPDMWEEIIEQTVEELAESAEKNHCEARFITYVKNKEKFPDVEDSDVEDLDDAMDILRDKMEEHAEKGVLGMEETVKLLVDLNDEVNKERMEFFSEINDSIKGMVFTERARLINGRYSTEYMNVDDAAIVKFMGAGRDERKLILEDRKPDLPRRDLFQAIKNITAYYPNEYDEGKIPDETSKLVHNPNISKPTNDDITARTIAMLTLAKESEWLIGNMGEAEALNRVEAVTENRRPKMGLKFEDVLNMSRPIPYISQAQRNGFTGAELGKAGLKLWAWVTAVSNVMAARKNPESLLRNPWMYLSGLTIYGLHKVKQNPEMADYYKKDPANRERIKTNSALILLATTKERRKQLNNFIGHPSEFSVMKEIEPEDVTALMKIADERGKEEGKPPVITKKDIAESLNISDKDAINALIPANDRMRYLFYEKFLKKEPNIRELQKNCKKWIT